MERLIVAAITVGRVRKLEIYYKFKNVPMSLGRFFISRYVF